MKWTVGSALDCKWPWNFLPFHLALLGLWQCFGRTSRLAAVQYTSYNCFSTISKCWIMQRSVVWHRCIVTFLHSQWTKLCLWCRPDCSEGLDNSLKTLAAIPAVCFYSFFIHLLHRLQKCTMGSLIRRFRRLLSDPVWEWGLCGSHFPPVAQKQGPGHCGIGSEKWLREKCKLTRAAGLWIFISAIQQMRVTWLTIHVLRNGHCG